MKDLICIQDLMNEAQKTKDYFRVLSIVTGLPKVMDEWIHADNLIEKTELTDASATVQAIVKDLPKFDLDQVRKAAEAPESCPAAEPEAEEEPEL